jgi:transcriptional regulator with XRE-family HTH domain
MDPRDKRTKIEGQPADEARALTSRVRSVEQGNVAAFDELADQLGLTLQRSLPQRWVARVGRLLRTARDRRAMDQGTVAEKSELTQSYLSRLENGLLAKRGPTADVLMRCAQAMGCDLEFTLRSKENGEVVAQVSSAHPVVYPAIESQAEEAIAASPLEVVPRVIAYRMHGARLQVSPPGQALATFIIEDPDAPEHVTQEGDVVTLKSVGRVIITHCGESKPSGSPSGRPVVGFVECSLQGKEAPRIKGTVTLAKGEAVVIRQSGAESKVTRARKSRNLYGRILGKPQE